MSFFTGWFDPESTSGDVVAPTITLVSPAEPDLDTDGTITVDVTDSSGFGTITILVSGAGFTGTQVVYAFNAFVTPFTSGVKSTITDGYRFAFSYSWEAGEIEVTVLAADADGNFTSEVFSWEVEAAAPGDDLTPQPFRDSVWRWRRRLNRQKCSVISIAIDDNYTPGPGFTLTALALEIGRKPGLDRIAWRNGTSSNPSGSGSNSDGT